MDKQVNDWLPWISTVASVVGVILSLFVLHYTKKIKRRLMRYADIREFNGERIEREEEIRKLHDRITDVGAFEPNVLNRLLVQAEYLRRYSPIMGFGERIGIRSCIRSLQKNASPARSLDSEDKAQRKRNNKVLSEIAYLASMYKKKRIETI